jgi:hypothetical protein
MDSCMTTALSAFGPIRQLGEFATHPLARLVARLPLSLVVAGNGLLPPRFAADTRPDAPSSAPTTVSRFKKQD